MKRAHKTRKTAVQPFGSSVVSPSVDLPRKGRSETQRQPINHIDRTTADQNNKPGAREKTMQVSTRTVSSSSRKPSTITSNAAHWIMLSLHQVHNIYSTRRGNSTTNNVLSQQAPHRVQVPTNSNARRLIRSAARLHAPAPKAGSPPPSQPGRARVGNDAMGIRLPTCLKLIQDKRKTTITKHTNYGIRNAQDVC